MCLTVGWHKVGRRSEKVGTVSQMKLRKDEFLLITLRKCEQASDQ